MICSFIYLCEKTFFERTENTLLQKQVDIQRHSEQRVLRNSRGEKYKDERVIWAIVVQLTTQQSRRGDVSSCQQRRSLPHSTFSRAFKRQQSDQSAASRKHALLLPSGPTCLHRCSTVSVCSSCTLTLLYDTCLLLMCSHARPIFMQRPDDLRRDFISRRAWSDNISRGVFCQQAEEEVRLSPFFSTRPFLKGTRDRSR